MGKTTIQSCIPGMSSFRVIVDDPRPKSSHNDAICQIGSGSADSATHLDEAGVRTLIAALQERLGEAPSVSPGTGRSAFSS